MNDIEQKIRIPRPGLPLQNYVRVYAYLNGGVVLGAYYAPGNGGYKLTEVCFDGHKKIVSCGAHQFKETQLIPGQRKWIEHYENLPDVSGGGCSYVRVQYDVASKQITKVACNGPY
jgi:hypothetical protein